MIPTRLLATLALAAALTAACSNAQVECDCANLPLTVSSPDVPLAQLTATGAACSYHPVCPYSDAGACSQYQVALTAAGTCRLIATAVDGRQVTIDVTVQLASSGGCCGDQFVVESGNVVLQFP